MNEKKDYWSAKTYAGSASFVYNPKITQKILQYLDPQPNDKVLDVGCGDGRFTSNYLESVAEVYGVDASASFIQSATEDHGKSGKARFKLVDCRYLESDHEAVNSRWDKVVSNAALHWILRDENTRVNTLKACHDALKPGGRFVFEMGGIGNVAEAHTALLSTLKHHGLSAAAIRKADPWFFPSEKWMDATLNKVGFQVEKLELEYRPTPCTSNENGGLEGWVRLMGAQLIDALPEAKREAAIKEVCEILEPVVTRVEDGSKWLGYVRLRGVAVRPY